MSHKRKKHGIPSATSRGCSWHRTNYEEQRRLAIALLRPPPRRPSDAASAVLRSSFGRPSVNSSLRTNYEGKRFSSSVSDAMLSRMRGKWISWLKPLYSGENCRREILKRMWCIINMRKCMWKKIIYDAVHFRNFCKYWKGNESHIFSCQVETGVTAPYGKQKGYLCNVLSILDGGTEELL